MPRLSYVIAGLVLSSLLGACVGPEQSVASGSRADGTPQRRAPAAYTVAKQIRYSFTLRNTTNRLLPKAEFWTYAPVPQSSHQWVERIAATQSYRVSRDSLGNEVLHFELGNIPPYGAKIVSITVDLKMAEQPVAFETGDLGRFIRPEPYIESNDAKLAELARGIRDRSTMLTVQKTYDWVAGNMRSETYIPEDRGAVYALTARNGDCTEFAYLLTAMNRANQIPSRPIGGYVFHGNAVVKAPDFHNWTEFFADGHWQIADAQKKAFMRNQADYVSMRIIASDQGGPLNNSHRYSYAGQGLEVQMN